MSSRQSEPKGVALITGAAQGIGRAIALRLADDGYDIAVNDLQDMPELDEVIKTIEEKGRRALATPGDVSEELVVIEMIQRTVSTLGSLDVMVANAGIVIPEPFLETSVAAFDKQMAVNARSVMLCYKYAAEQMIAQGRGGRIIGASSMAGKQGVDMLLAYSATKFAVRGMTQSAASSLGKHNITVNAYAPGGVETRILNVFDDFLEPLAGPRAGRDGLIKSSVVGRIGEPEEIAHLVSYLASKEAGFITGQTVRAPLYVSTLSDLHIHRFRSTEVLILTSVLI
ncbi:NAD(P)-binding protein [Multifurca ochricompacta]|uniref:NAD(P)-binding protein n=1 Tax=Multifurca ochricompacta TaxID=376703 RepID=A0AAD4QM25_9AGAM|nr:NAD(P)-binding protein [Multifurca ochricompacta]